MCARLPRSIWSKQIVQHVTQTAQADAGMFALSKAMPWIIPDLVKDNIIRIVPPEWISHCVFRFQVAGDDITKLESIMRLLKRVGSTNTDNVFHSSRYQSDGLTDPVVKSLHTRKQNYCTVFHHLPSQPLFTVTTIMFDIKTATTILRKLKRMKVEMLTEPSAILHDASVLSVKPDALYIMPIAAEQPPMRMRLCELIKDDNPIMVMSTGINLTIA
jgi:hypothetical protein